MIIQYDVRCPSERSSLSSAAAVRVVTSLSETPLPHSPALSTTLYQPVASALRRAGEEGGTGISQRTEKDYWRVRESAYRARWNS